MPSDAIQEVAAGAVVAMPRLRVLRLLRSMRGLLGLRDRLSLRYEVQMMPDLKAMTFKELLKLSGRLDAEIERRLKEHDLTPSDIQLVGRALRTIEKRGTND